MNQRFNYFIVLESLIVTVAFTTPILGARNPMPWADTVVAALI